MREIRPFRLTTMTVTFVPDSALEPILVTSIRYKYMYWRTDIDPRGENSMMIGDLSRL